MQILWAGLPELADPEGSLKWLDKKVGGPVAAH